jgi:hypothetical protein
MDIKDLIEELGITAVARACQVKPPTVHRWKCRNKLPRTDYTGETEYAKAIARLRGGISYKQILGSGR